MHSERGGVPDGHEWLGPEEEEAVERGSRPTLLSAPTSQPQPQAGPPHRLLAERPLPGGAEGLGVPSEQEAVVHT